MQTAALKMQILTLSASYLLFNLDSIYALAEPPRLPAEQPRVSVTFKNSKEGTPQFVSWNFELAKNTKLNLEAPWQLKVEGQINFAKGKNFNLLKQDIPVQDSSFELKLENLISDIRSSNTNRSSKFELVYFYCDAQNKWCRRVLEKGNVTLN